MTGPVQPQKPDPFDQIARRLEIGSKGDPFDAIAQRLETGGSTVEDRINAMTDLSPSERQAHINRLHQNRTALAQLGNDADNYADPNLLQRIADNLTEFGHSVVHDPFGTATTFAAAPFKSAGTAAVAPGVGEARHDPRLSKGGAPPQMTNADLARDLNTPYDAEHGGVTETERSAAGAQALANIVAPELGGAKGGALVGASYVPEDPLAGAGAGGVIGQILHKTGDGAREAKTRATEAFKPPIDAAFRDLASESRGVPPVTDEAAADNNRVRVSAFDEMLRDGAAKMPFRNRGAAAPPDVSPDANGVGAFEEMLRGGAKAKPGKVAPIELQDAATTVANEATERGAPAEAARDAEELRQEELTRQAALRSLTGVRRRPGNVLPVERTEAAPGALPEVGQRPERMPASTPDVGRRPERVPASTPDVGRAEEAPSGGGLLARMQAAMDERAKHTAPIEETPADIPPSGKPKFGALTSYPEGFSMGDTEPRMPEIPKRGGKPIEQIGKGPGQYLTKDQVAAFAPESAPMSAAPPAEAKATSLLDKIEQAMKAATETTPETGTEPTGPAAKRIKRPPRGTELSDDSRYEDGSRRPAHLVSVKGLVRELVDLEDKRVDAARRSAYEFNPDDNFHSTEDGRSVLSATRRHKGEASEQAKAFQNAEDYARIDREVMHELTKARGLPSDMIEELITRERDAKAERGAMQAADDRPDKGDTSFDFGHEPMSFEDLRENPDAADRLAGHEGPLDFQPEDRTVRAGEPERRPAEEFQSPQERAALDRARELLDGTSNALPDLPAGRPRTVNERLLNPRTFDQSPEIQDQLTNAEAGMEIRGITKHRIPIKEGRARVQKMTRDALVEMGMDPTSMDLRKVGRLSGEEIVAFKQHATQLMDEIAAISKHLEGPGLSAEEHGQFAELMQKTIEERDQVLERVVHASSQKGRDLGFLRQIANRTLDPDVWVVQARRISGDRPLSDAVITEIRKLARETAEACG